MAQGVFFLVGVFLVDVFLAGAFFAGFSSTGFPLGVLLRKAVISGHTWS
jgi:hypothetical protein